MHFARQVITAILVLETLRVAVGEDLTLCESLPTFVEEEYELDEDFNNSKISISGFKASITYVSKPEGTGSKYKMQYTTRLCALFPPLTKLFLLSYLFTDKNAVVKIKSASESTVVDIANGYLGISTGTCVDDPKTPPSAANQLTFPGFIAMSLFASTGYIPLATTALLSFLTVGVSAAEEESCTPTIDIEIGLPYACPYDNFIDGVCRTPRQIADLAVQALFVDFDVEAARSLLATDYIQHNPTVPTGAAPVLNFLPALQASGLAIETHRTLSEGNLVAYHSTYTNATLFGGETLIGFDVFRVERGQVQEHWDNLQELAGPNPSGHTMVDGPTMIKYWSQTQANKERALALVNGVLVEGNASVAPLYIAADDYTQHNPSIVDGLEGLGAALQNLAAQNLSFAYDSVELVVAEGNFVLTGSPGGAGNPTAYYDLFRLDAQGLIVEHWDVIQAIPPEFAHENGKF